jgi:hypothetical protein
MLQFLPSSVQYLSDAFHFIKKVILLGLCYGHHNMCYRIILIAGGECSNLCARVMRMIVRARMPQYTNGEASSARPWGGELARSQRTQKGGSL